MPNVGTKVGKGQFVKDAVSEEFLEIGFDKIYKLSLTTTEEFDDGTRFIKLEVSLGHDSIMKILKLLNPKRIRWQMGEPPSEEAKQKYGTKARWTWNEYDNKQLRLVSK